MNNAFKERILIDIKQMKDILVILEGSEDNKIISGHFNCFVDLFVSVTNTLRLNKINSIDILNEDFGDLIVNAVNAFNENKLTLFFTVLNLIRHKFEQWSKFMKENLKYKVIVLGINQLTTIVDKIIDLDKAEIIHYVDDGNQNIGKYINGNKIVDLSQVANVTYDYFFSVSENEQLISQLMESGIIESNRFINYNLYKRLIVISPEFFIKHNEFLYSEKNYTGILTGLSYVQKGVNEKNLKGKFLNFAYPGQDIFYDFQMFKYAYGFNEVRKNLKYGIIGLSYYSFHYDLSKSVNAARVNYYYPFTKTMHNNGLSDKYLLYHNKIEEFEEKILKENHFFESFEPEKKYFKKIIFEGWMEQYNCQKRTDDELLEDITSVKRDFDKDYSLTVLENKKILRDYLEFLELHSINPIIVVCPATKLYQAFTPQSFKDEFYEIINELNKEIEFQFLDYFHSLDFNDTDFYDVSHMNKKGSSKFANLLNQHIIW